MEHAIRTLNSKRYWNRTAKGPRSKIPEVLPPSASTDPSLASPSQEKRKNLNCGLWSRSLHAYLDLMALHFRISWTPSVVGNLEIKYLGQAYALPRYLEQSAVEIFLSMIIDMLPENEGD